MYMTLATRSVVLDLEGSGGERGRVLGNDGLRGVERAEGDEVTVGGSVVDDEVRNLAPGTGGVRELDGRAILDLVRAVAGLRVAGHPVGEVVGERDPSVGAGAGLGHAGTVLRRRGSGQPDV